MSEGDALFERLVEHFSGDPSVTPPAAKGGKFGSAGLKVGGKIFAMVSRDGDLVVKLPRERVDELITSGTGERFDPGHGRLMKAWVSISPRHRRSWQKLAEEARDYVAE